jgi:hypothetical protein
MGHPMTVPEDPFTGEGWEAYAKSVREDLIPKIDSSAITVSLAPDGQGDVKYAVELGFSIMMDKPILVVISPGQQIPPKLRVVADAIVEADITTTTGQRDLQRAIESMLKLYGNGEDAPA